MHDGSLVKKHLDAMLAAAPGMAQQIMDATMLRLRDAGPGIALAQDRRQLFELLEALQTHHLTLVRSFAQRIQLEIERATQTPQALPRSAGPMRLEDLTLMDEDQAEKDIEISRTIQLIDLKAEWELRELQALSATLMNESVLRPEANPCRPSVYAKAFSHMAHQLNVSKASRGLFLRTGGFALAEVLRDVYGDACRRIKGWGVQPLEYRNPPAVGRSGTVPEVDLTQPDALISLRDRLPRHHQGQPSPDVAALGATLEQALHHLNILIQRQGPTSTNLLRQNEQGLQSLIASAAQQQTVDLLSRLFDQILADPRLASTVKDLIGRLQVSVLRVALNDPTLLSSHEHPTWSLINQIAARAADHPQAGDERGSAFMAFVEPLIERLAGDEAPNASLYKSALADVQAFIEREADVQLQQSQAAVKALAEAEQRQALLPLLRQQVMHQLQSAALSETLRRFLMGPWVEVLARAMVSQGTDNAETQTLVGTVDELLWSLERPASELDREEVRQRLPSLIARLKLGMDLIDLPQAERERVLDDLMQTHSRRLRPVRAAEAAQRPATDEASPHDLVQQMRNEVLPDDEEHPADNWVQDTSVGSLPTVPMDLGGADEDGRAKGAAQRWLLTLTKGMRCKLFLQGQWVTAHLLWRSDNGEFFMFTSSLAGGMHSMTRRALERLRIEGLATTFVEHSLMQRAVDSVLQDLDEP